MVGRYFVDKLRQSRILNRYPLADSVMAFKQRNKLGRFSDEASESSQASEKAQEEASKVIHLGDRCEVQLTDDATLRKRGCVRFIGKSWSK